MPRIFGWLALAVTLFQLETPSFVTFLVVKGVLAMLVLTEVAGVALPLACGSLSAWRFRTMRPDTLPMGS